MGIKAKAIIYLFVRLSYIPNPFNFFLRIALGASCTDHSQIWPRHRVDLLHFKYTRKAPKKMSDTYNVEYNLKLCIFINVGFKFNLCILKNLEVTNLTVDPIR